MNIRFTTVASALVCALAVGVTPSPAAAAEDEVTLRGCLIKGDGDGAGYLLSNAPGRAGVATFGGREDSARCGRHVRRLRIDLLLARRR